MIGSVIARKRSDEAIPSPKECHCERSEAIPFENIRGTESYSAILSLFDNHCSAYVRIDRTNDVILSRTKSERRILSIYFGIR